MVSNVLSEKKFEKSETYRYTITILVSWIPTVTTKAYIQVKQVEKFFTQLYSVIISY